MNESISRRDWLRILGGCGLVAGVGTPAGGRVRAQESGFQSSIIASNSLKLLNTIYLSTHSLTWLSVPPSDARREEERWERFPGRSELCYQRDLRLKEELHKVLQEASRNEDTGMFILPNDMKPGQASEGDRLLIGIAEEYFGSRSAVLRNTNPNALGETFLMSVDEDVREARMRRGSLTQMEIDAWRRSKAWAVYLKRQLESQGYTFDPSSTTFIAWGGGWAACAATYPIHMGAAWGLECPVVRRFDISSGDEGELYLKAVPLAQDLPMPGNDNIRLFVYKSHDGRYFAEYWEGKRGIKDPGHIVSLDFPDNSVTTLTVQDLLRGKLVGEKRYGRIEAGVGGGAHTGFLATLILAEEGLTYDDFYAVLISGKIFSIN